LSFTCNPGELHDQRKHKEISQTVGKLKGTWKLSYGDKVNYFIFPVSYFISLSKKKIQDISEMKSEKMHPWVKIKILREFEEISK
jgi:hypothetical protein